MPSPLTPFLALSLLAGLQTAPLDDPIAETRRQLDGQRRELLATVADKAWMEDGSRAMIVRMRIERNWEMCAANEGWALAKTSERPARLLAERALTACAVWEQAFATALANGADPYLNGMVSREDQVSGAQLRSRDAAVSRIMLWRGAPSGPAQTAVASRNPNPGPVGPAVSILSQRAFPKAVVTAPPAKVAAEPEEKTDGPEIVVVAQPGNQCQVRLADRTLTDSELRARAEQWAATGTPLRVVRPRGATYGCLAKIARHLNGYGVHLLQIVEP